MKVVVIGGAGLIGSKLVTRLREHGHQPVPASPDTQFFEFVKRIADDATDGNRVRIPPAQQGTVVPLMTKELADMPGMYGRNHRPARLCHNRAKDATIDRNRPSDPVDRMTSITPQVKGSGMVAKNIAAAGLTGLLLSAAAGLAPAAAQQPQSLASDSIFIQRAGSGGLLQVKLGQLAEKKGTSPAVVEFARRMVTDYSKANEELEAAAKAAGFPSPVLLRQDQQIFDRFNGMGRSRFDKAYMTEMVKQHSEEVRLFEGEAAGGRVQSLKQLASRMLPGIEQRRSLATETAGSVGADLTASSAAASEGSATR